MQDTKTNRHTAIPNRRTAVIVAEIFTTPEDSPHLAATVLTDERGHNMKEFDSLEDAEDYCLRQFRSPIFVTRYKHHTLVMLLEGGAQ